jgi:hypothetical protein
LRFDRLWPSDGWEDGIGSITSWLFEWLWMKARDGGIAAEGWGRWPGKAQPYRTAGAVGAGGAMAELVGCGRFFHTFAALPHGGRHSPRRLDTQFDFKEII